MNISTNYSYIRGLLAGIEWTPKSTCSLSTGWRWHLKVPSYSSSSSQKVCRPIALIDHCLTRYLSKSRMRKAGSFREYLCKSSLNRIIVSRLELTNQKYVGIKLNRTICLKEPPPARPSARMDSILDGSEKFVSDMHSIPDVHTQKTHRQSSENSSSRRGVCSAAPIAVESKYV